MQSLLPGSEISPLLNGDSSLFQLLKPQHVRVLGHVCIAPEVIDCSHGMRLITYL